MKSFFVPEGNFLPVVVTIEIEITCDPKRYKRLLKSKISIYCNRLRKIKKVS